MLISDARAFAALVQESLDSALGAGTSEVEVLAPPAAHEDAVQFSLTFKQGLDFGLPEASISSELDESQLRYGAVAVSAQLARELAVSMSTLSTAISAAQDEQFVPESWQVGEQTLEEVVGDVGTEEVPQEAG